MNPAASPTRAFHVWFSTKGRKPVLVEGIREAVLSLIRKNAAKAGVRVVEAEAIEDHVHLLRVLSAGQSLADVMHQSRARVPGEMLHRHPELSFDMKSQSFWQKSYGARPVPPGQIEVVRTYITTQSDRPLRHE